MDAQLAAGCGADAIGMVFHKLSPRGVSAQTALEILDALPPFVTPVGLFVDADIKTIRETCAPLGIRHVQLNGHEPAHLVIDLSEFFTVIKAVRVEPGKLEQALTEWRIPSLKGIVLETASSQPGGSGLPNDWAQIAQAKSNRAFANLPPIIAAGGLRPETVGEVVRTIRPYAVDVSSGVEEKPGEKSPDKIRDFIEAVHQADASRS